jgi:hypothetical protein
VTIKTKYISENHTDSFILKILESICPETKPVPSVLYHHKSSDQAFSAFTELHRFDIDDFTYNLYLSNIVFFDSFV